MITFDYSAVAMSSWILISGKLIILYYIRILSLFGGNLYPAAQNINILFDSRRHTPTLDCLIVTTYFHTIIPSYTTDMPIAPIESNTLSFHVAQTTRNGNSHTLSSLTAHTPSTIR